MSDAPEVLVVDDEPRLTDLFAAWLEEAWTVETAYDGKEALEKMTESIDIVLLDRRMPGLTGDEVLSTIRDDGYDCRVVMVTAVDPDFDIIELGFDDYLTKPISKAELLEMVENVVNRSAYEAAVRTYFALTSKKSLLEAEKTDRELADHEEYQQLCEDVSALAEQVDEEVSSLSAHDDFVDAFEDI